MAGWLGLRHSGCVLLAQASGSGSATRDRLRSSASSTMLQRHGQHCSRQVLLRDGGRRCSLYRKCGSHKWRNVFSCSIFILCVILAVQAT